MPGGACDPTARMRSRAAKIKSLDGHAIIAVPQDRPCGKQLIQCQMAVHDIAGREAEYPL